MSENQPIKINFTRDGIQKLLRNEPLISSNHAKWNGVYFEYRQSTAYEVPEYSPCQHLVIINTQVCDYTQYEQKLDNRLQHDPLRKGDVVIIPANVGHRARYYTMHYYVLLSIDTALFQNSALMLTDLDRIDLIPHFAMSDPLLCGIGLALKQELEYGKGSSQFYVDSLTTTMIAHLIKNYTDRKVNLKFYGNFSKQKMQQIIDYIHDNIERDISLTELAKIATVTPNYFATSFKDMVGISPHQYIIRCKVDRAKQLLVNGERSIVRIAQDLGFCHQSHLNYHFKRLIGMTPKYFQKNCGSTEPGM